MAERRILSRHFLRRRARIVERDLQHERPGDRIKVVKASRGPHRWWVVVER